MGADHKKFIKVMRRGERAWRSWAELSTKECEPAPAVTIKQQVAAVIRGGR